MIANGQSPRYERPRARRSPHRLGSAAYTQWMSPPLRRLFILGALLLIAPTSAVAHDSGAGRPGVTGTDPSTGSPRLAAIGERCGGDPITPDKVIEGNFASSIQGSYVMVPFRVPKRTDAVRVKYCFDQPERDTPITGHTLDLGLWDARQGRRPWSTPDFRGWGGSSHPDVTVSPQGFSKPKRYLEDPKGDVYGRTTRGFIPGRVPAGEWAVELGAASIIPSSQGDANGSVAWRVEIDLIRDRSLNKRPYEPRRYDSTPARRSPGWYAGDLHVHAEHSALGDATMREVFDYAFKPASDGGAGLDFITLSDYVTDSAWGEIGRYQEDYPGKLIDRSSEVITYRGHIGNHASERYVDHRTGPVLERQPDGALTSLRGPRPASMVFEKIRAAGGFTQINHPTIFPNAVPTFGSLCRGCSWDYSVAETDYSKVDAIEIATGPPGLRTPIEIGPNPFTLTALDFYQRALATGNRIAAVGVSDSHLAGRTRDPLTQAPVGTATTVLYAKRLSEQGIAEAVRAGHTYVKVFGNSGPDLRFDAKADGTGERAIMGDALGGREASFRARVIGADPALDLVKPGPYLLLVLRNGALHRVVPITARDQSFDFRSNGPGRYQLQLMRGTGVAALSSPIYLGP